MRIQTCDAYKQQLGQALVEKFLDVGDPFLVQATEKIGRGVEPAEEGGKGEYGGVHWHPMILLERWVIASLLSLGLASTAGAPAQSPAGKAQQKQPAQPSPELPPWDSAQPPPPIRPPSPEDSATRSRLRCAGTSDDAAKTPDAGPPAQTPQPAPAPASAPAPPAQPAPRQEAAQPAPPEDEGPTLPPSSDPAQRQMEKDTARLLQLVRELKTEVNKAGSNTLSLAALQKTDEIQRLVKSLKEQMRERGQGVVSKP